MKQNKDCIDFVITWVDGNDPEWLKEKKKYEEKEGRVSPPSQFREWDNLKYIFRGIERFAPWVNKVHFITCGHVPEWLNPNHPKLHLVKHSDYIPAEHLPTFSSHPIELNMHRIEGLSDKFVYLNDDTFLIDKVTEEDFFKKGLPCSACGLDIINPAYDFLFYNILRNDINVICRHFNGKEFVKKNKSKLFNPHYDLKYIKTLFLLPWSQSDIPGFINPHLPTPYLKSTFDTVWKKEEELLYSTSSHKFRNEKDVNPYVFTYWQYVTGQFSPIKMKKYGRFFYIKKDEGQYEAFIKNHKAKFVCLNDDLHDTDEAKFEQLKHNLINTFEAILPDKSSYEL